MDATADIMTCEETLRQAMLTSDVAQLTLLLSDTLIFTNQAGTRLTKQDDLAAHQSGLLRIEALDFTEPPVVRMLGDTAVVAVTAKLAGRYGDHAFAGTFAYSRVWHRSGGRWQVEAGHCSAVVS